MNKNSNNLKHQRRTPLKIYSELIQSIGGLKTQIDSHNDSDSDSTLDEDYYKLFQDILINKREAKQLRNIHNEMFNIYASKLGPLELKTANSYSKMISQFILYSPSIDPDDLDQFLSIKFNLNKKRYIKTKLNRIIHEVL